MNAKIIKYSFVLLLITCLVSACKEDEVMVFNGENNVYFSLQRWGNLPSGITYTVDYTISEADGETHISESWTYLKRSKDSLVVSLALEASEADKFQLVPVSLLGNIVDYDRPLSYAIGAKSEIKEGEGFSIEEAKIPAGKNIGSIVLRLDREAFRDNTYAIDLELKANEHFQTNYKKMAYSTSDTAKVDLLRFRVIVSDILQKPTSWLASFGTFSREKIYLVVELTGGDINAFYAEKLDAGLMFAWQSVLKNYLAKRAAEGDPVLEADGSLMTVS